MNNILFIAEENNRQHQEYHQNFYLARWGFVADNKNHVTVQIVVKPKPWFVVHEPFFNISDFQFVLQEPRLRVAANNLKLYLR